MTIQTVFEVCTAHLSDDDEFVPPVESPGIVIGPACLCMHSGEDHECMASAFVLIGDDDSEGQWRQDWPVLAKVYDQARASSGSAVVFDAAAGPAVWRSMTPATTGPCTCAEGPVTRRRG